MLREYEMREKALYDYKSSISAALKRGEQKGMKRGKQEGRKEGKQEGIKEGMKKGSIIALQQIGYSAEKIASTLGMAIEEVSLVLNTIKT
jgi:predicted transposase YdaD